MRLVSLDYSEFHGMPAEWVLEGLTLGQINLLVGKNATGKSRIINIISTLAKLLSGQLKEVLVNGRFKVIFEQDKTTYRYILEHECSEVLKEELYVDDKKLLYRGSGGVGKIHAEEIGKDMRFQAPTRELAAVARRDSIQHPFLQPLHEWGSSVRHFEFGKTMGHTTLGLAFKHIQVELDDKDTNQVIPILHHGSKQFGDSFKQSIITDMAAVGYQIEDLMIQRPTAMVITGFPPPGELTGIAIKERELPSAIDQYIISQGMFRALSLVIQLNFGLMSRRAMCILVDDIGEGLDFERSCAIIDLLRRKAQGSSIQLIMSTNDRFVMNKVPLEEWCLLQRTANKVRVRDYRNSKQAFDRFKITGLNNFDFLATDFIDKVGTNG
jgi:energy-coupling factor transporter ATP-binding protein EcfA2